MHGIAITAACLAAVVAFPVSASGQPAPQVLFPRAQSASHLPFPFAGPAPDERSGHLRYVTMRFCLRHGRCDANQEGLDRKILFTIRGWNSRASRAVFGAADATAYPVFAAAPIVLWGGALAGELTRDDALAGSAALVTGFGSTMILKRLVGRSRPYAAIDGFTARSGHAGAVGLSDTASFPSGHATLAGIVGAGTALLIGHPAATASAAVWAVTVSTSRLWLGVHYPSDVAAGLSLGAGSTLLLMSVLR